MDSEVDEILIQREDQWRQALAAKFQESTDKLRRRDNEIRSLNDKFEMIQRDFIYNLGLLQNRDTELENYEQTFVDLNKTLQEKSQEITDLKMKLNEQELLYQNLDEEHNLMKHQLHQQIVEMKEVHDNLQRQFKLASKQWSDEMATLQQSQERKALNLKHDFYQQQSELENKHADIICKEKKAHSSEIEELQCFLLQEKENVKSLNQLLQDHQNKNTQFQNKITSLEMRINENKEIYESELRETYSCRQNLQFQFKNIFIKVKDTYELLNKDDTTQERAAASQHVPVRSTIFVDDDKSNNTNFPLCDENNFEQMMSMLDEMHVKIKYYKRENSLLEAQLTKWNEGNCGTNQNKIFATQREEFHQLQKQNNILKEIIREMKNKIHSDIGRSMQSNLKDNVITSADTSETHTGSTKPKSVNIQQETIAAKQCKVKYRQSIGKVMVQKEANGHELEEIDDNDEINESTIKGNRCKKSNTQCHECKLAATEIISQNDKMDELLRKLNEKVETLTKDIEERDSGDDDCNRICQLEETIECLKTRMINEICNKFKGGDGDSAMTFSDVKMMILEQKLDHVTDIIGTTVISEKNVVLQAMKDVKEELMSTLKDGTNNNHSLDKVTELIRREHSDTQKYNDMLENIKKEMKKLEVNLSHKIENETTTLQNNGEAIHGNICSKWNGVCCCQQTHLKIARQYVNANDPLLLLPDLNSQTNPMNKENTEFVHDLKAVYPIINENKFKENVEVKLPNTHHSKEQRVEGLVTDSLTGSPVDPDMQQVWNLLKDKSQLDVRYMNGNGLSVRPVILCPTRREPVASRDTKTQYKRKIGTLKHNVPAKPKVRNYSIKH